MVTHGNSEQTANFEGNCFLFNGQAEWILLEQVSEREHIAVSFQNIQFRRKWNVLVANLKNFFIIPGHFIFLAERSYHAVPQS